MTSSLGSGSLLSIHRGSLPTLESTNSSEFHEADYPFIKFATKHFAEQDGIIFMKFQQFRGAKGEFGSYLIRSITRPSVADHASNVLTALTL